MYHYKLELYKKIKPEILALGSSRVMQIRQDSFKVKFANAGGAISSLASVDQFVKQILPVYKPKVVLWGLDFWWFNKTFQPPVKWKTPPKESKRLSLDKLMLPTQWLFAGKIGFSDYLKKSNPFCAKSPNLGVQGNNKNSGFLPDGSYFYAEEYFVDSKSGPELQKETKAIENRIRKGIDRFTYCNKHSDQHFSMFLEILKEFKIQEIEVIVFFPPVSPDIYNTMEKFKDNYKYVEYLKTALNDEQVPFYDFHNPSQR